MTTPDPVLFNHHASTIDAEQACGYGCKLKNTHWSTCPCHDQCPTHEGHCPGCAPRPSHDTSLLCGSCFQRRLRRPLRRITPLYDWLTTRKAGLRATAYDRDLVTATKEQPLPFNAAVVDLLDEMDVLLNGWATRVAHEGHPGPRPPVGAPAAAIWLDERSAWISDQDWVPGFIHHLAVLNSKARELAPWQPTRHALPLPCLRCEQQTLVLFGGEDWVTCTATDCDNVIGWARYERLSRAIAGVHDREVG